MPTDHDIEHLIKFGVRTESNDHRLVAWAILQLRDAVRDLNRKIPAFEVVGEHQVRPPLV